MSFFNPQNPGIGGLEELTPAEEAFLTTFAGLTYNEGDTLVISDGALAWQPSSASEMADSLLNYKLTDLDDSTSTEYYGYLDKDGNWYIKKITSDDVRYVKGTSDYTTNWTGRAGLSYDYFNNAF